MQITRVQTSLRSLISAFVIPFLETIISKLATGEISIFYLVSVAEETGLSLFFFENPEQVFSRQGPYDIMSGNNIRPCIKIDQPLVMYIFSNVMYNVAFFV